MSRRRITVGVVDYGASNLASVARSLAGLGYRCRSSSDPETLGAADVMVLPGVGAFPAAMQALHKHRLVEFIQAQARRGQPIVGICLGMQLLAHSSSELRFTTGLGLIPGQVQPLQAAKWHIGWNSLEVLDSEPLRVNDSPDQAFTVAVRRQQIVGLQFHPEKSQLAGRELLKNVIEGLLP